MTLLGSPITDYFDSVCICTVGLAKKTVPSCLVELDHFVLSVYRCAVHSLVALKALLLVLFCECVGVCF